MGFEHRNHGLSKWAIYVFPFQMGHMFFFLLNGPFWQLGLRKHVSNPWYRARSHNGRWGGPKGKELDKKLIWSRYKSTNVNIRTQPAAYATTQRLNTKENLLVLGCSNGDILMYNSNTDRHVAAYNCCSSPIVNLEVKEGLLLTTQRFGATKVDNVR